MKAHIYNKISKNNSHIELDMTTDLHSCFQTKLQGKKMLMSLDAFT